MADVTSDMTEIFVVPEVSDSPDASSSSTVPTQDATATANIDEPAVVNEFSIKTSGYPSTTALPITSKSNDTPKVLDYGTPSLTPSTDYSFKDPYNSSTEGRASHVTENTPPIHDHATTSTLLSYTKISLEESYNSSTEGQANHVTESIQTALDDASPYTIFLKRFILTESYTSTTEHQASQVAENNPSLVTRETNASASTFTTPTEKTGNLSAEEHLSSIADVLSTEITKLPLTAEKGSFTFPTTPLVETSSPLVETSSPLVETSSPLVEASSPLVEASSPLVETSSPLVETSSPSPHLPRSEVVVTSEVRAEMNDTLRSTGVRAAPNKFIDSFNYSGDNFAEASTNHHETTGNEGQRGTSTDAHTNLSIVVSNSTKTSEFVAPSTSQSSDLVSTTDQLTSTTTILSETQSKPYVSDYTTPAFTEKLTAVYDDTSTTNVLTDTPLYNETTVLKHTTVYSKTSKQTVLKSTSFYDNNTRETTKLLWDNTTDSITSVTTRNVTEAGPGLWFGIPSLWVIISAVSVLLLLMMIAIICICHVSKKKWKKKNQKRRGYLDDQLTSSFIRSTEEPNNKKRKPGKQSSSTSPYPKSYLLGPKLLPTASDAIRLRPRGSSSGAVTPSTADTPFIQRPGILGKAEYAKLTNGGQLSVPSGNVKESGDPNEVDFGTWRKPGIAAFGGLIPAYKRSSLANLVENGSFDKKSKKSTEEKDDSTKNTKELELTTFVQKNDRSSPNSNPTTTFKF